MTLIYGDVYWIVDGNLHLHLPDWVCDRPQLTKRHFMLRRPSFLGLWTDLNGPLYPPWTYQNGPHQQRKGVYI